MSEVETMRKLSEIMKELKCAVDKMKEESEVDVVKSYELDKQVEMTKEMKNMNYEELKAYLEKKYDQMNEIQVKEETERKRFINENSITLIKMITDNMEYTNDCNDININNINLTINTLVDMMVSNENKKHVKEINAMNSEHSKRITEMNKLRKQTTSNEIVDVTSKVLSKKLNNRGYNEHVYKNLSKLEEWSGHQMDQVLYDSDIDGKSSSSIFRRKILRHSHLYFIVIDSNENVFGSYTDSDIYQVDSDIRSNNPFIFTLFSNGRCGVKKCKPIYSDQKIRIWNDWG